MVRIPNEVVVSSITFPFCIIFTFALYNTGFSNDHNCGSETVIVCLVCMMLSCEEAIMCSSFPASLPEGAYNSVNIVKAVLFGMLCMVVSTATLAASLVTDGVVM